MRQHVAVQRVERGIVDVGFKHALAEIIQNHHASHTPQATKSLLMQFRPGLRAGTEQQQPHCFAAVAQSQHKQPCPAVFPANGIAHQGARSVIDLAFFAGCSFDHRAGFRRSLATEIADEALDTLIAASEAAAIDQVLPNAFGVAALGEFQLDGFPVQLAGTTAGGCVGCVRRRGRQYRARVGGQFGTIGRFRRPRVGGHFVGRFCRRTPSPSTWRAQADSGRAQILSGGFSTDASGLLDLPQ